MLLGQGDFCGCSEIGPSGHFQKLDSFTVYPAVLNELFTRHLLTAEECSEVAGKGRWEDHLNQVLLTKPSEVVQEACQVLTKHGCSVKELKSELYYSSTLCQVVFQVLHYANLIVAHAPTAFVHTHTHTPVLSCRHTAHRVTWSSILEEANFSCCCHVSCSYAHLAHQHF